jgi:hypothetical protein
MFTRANPSTDPLSSRSGIAESDFHHVSLNHLEPDSPAELSTPFRKRDEQVLTELFHQEGIEAIEQDIACNLLWRCPEPCWEDDPFEFLQDFL